MKLLKESREDLRAELDKAIKALKSINPGVFYGALALYDMCGIEDLSKVSDKQLDELTDLADSVDSIYDEYVRAEIRDVCGDFVNESCKSKKKEKKLNETWKGDDVIDDLVDRAQSLINDGNYGDKSECVSQAIDDGLIYSRDIIDLAEHYGVIDDSELIERYYEDLYNDVYSRVEEPEEEEEDEEDEDDEDTNEKLEESIHVEIDEDDALEMLMDRVKFWDPDSTTYDLYEQMYQSYIDGGAFDGGEFDVMQIVDNDWVNWCSVVSPGDEQYDEILAAYKEDGLGDISTRDLIYDYIEAAKEEDGKIYFLCRQ